MSEKTQSGRSMLEMLAILAIVGILSIVIFVGYEMAMARHRANEIIKQTNNLALGVEEQFEYDVDDIDITSYIPEGSTILTIAGYEAYFEENDTTTAFEVTLEDVDQRVCERLLNSGWDDPFAILVNGVVSGTCLEKNEITAAFNNTLAGADPCQNMTCPGATVCQLGECVCPDGRDLCNANTGLCCAEDKVCTTAGDVPGTCRRNSTACTTNADCKDVAECEGITCYCHLTGELDGFTSGTCRELTPGIPLPTARADFPPLLSYKPKKFLCSESNMNYWAATNWCKAQKMRMVSLSDFHIRLDSWNYPIVPGNEGGSQANACSDSYASRRCDMPQTSFLNSALGGNSFWTIDDYASRFSWAVEFVSSGVTVRNRWARRNEVYKAMCK